MGAPAVAAAPLAAEAGMSIGAPALLGTGMSMAAPAAGAGMSVGAPAVGAPAVEAAGLGLMDKLAIGSAAGSLAGQGREALRPPAPPQTGLNQGPGAPPYVPPAIPTHRQGSGATLAELLQMIGKG